MAADPFNVIVLADAATAESKHDPPNDAFERSADFLLQVATSPEGRPLTSPEVAVQTSVLRRKDNSGYIRQPGREGTRPERRAGCASFRPPRRGSLVPSWAADGKLVAGQAACLQFKNLSIGSQIECGNRTFEIVGMFRADGGAHESELWGHLSNVAAVYRRHVFFGRSATQDDG